MDGTPLKLLRYIRGSQSEEYSSPGEEWRPPGEEWRGLGKLGEAWDARLKVEP